MSEDLEKEVICHFGIPGAILADLRAWQHLSRQQIKRMWSTYILPSPRPRSLRRLPSSCSDLAYQSLEPESITQQCLNKWVSNSLYEAITPTTILPPSCPSLSFYFPYFGSQHAGFCLHLTRQYGQVLFKASRVAQNYLKRIRYGFGKVYSSSSHSYMSADAHFVLKGAGSIPSLFRLFSFTDSVWGSIWVDRSC